jgi:hypothetical protein
MDLAQSERKSEKRSCAGTTSLQTACAYSRSSSHGHSDQKFSKSSYKTKLNCARLQRTNQELKKAEMFSMRLKNSSYVDELQT